MNISRSGCRSFAVGTAVLLFAVLVLAAEDLPVLDLKSGEKLQLGGDGKFEVRIDPGTKLSLRFYGVEGQIECDDREGQKIADGVTLLLQGRSCTAKVTPTKSGSVAQVQSPGEVTKSVTLAFPEQAVLFPTEIVVYGAMALLLIIGAVVWIYLRKRSAGDDSKEGFYTPHGRSMAARLGLPMAAGAAAAAPLPSPPAPSPLERDLATVKEVVDRLNVAFRTIDEAQRHLLPEIDRKLQMFLDNANLELNEEVSDIERELRKLHVDTRQEVSNLAARVENLSLQLERIEKQAHSGLARLFEALPATVLDRSLAVQTPDGRTLATRLDEAATQFLASAAANGDTAQRHLEQVVRLQRALAEFQHEASQRDPAGADTKLKPLAEDLDHMRGELEGLTMQGSQKRIRLAFGIEIGAQEPAHQTLTEAIASGIQREVVKLGNLAEYCQKRFILVAARVAAECADFADAQLDPDRTLADLQRALGAVFAGGGMQEIAPGKNEQFQAAFHSVLQVTRRASPADRSGAIARLVARGFRCGDRVIRKATVILFD